MKKTILITLDYLPQTGGVANYWAGLNKFLPTDFFYILAPKTAKENFEAQNVIRRKMLFDWIWPRWLKLLFIILNLQKKHFFHNFIAGQILPIGSVLWLLKKFNFIENYFISCHGFDILQLQGKKKFLAKIIMNSADTIIVNSEFTKKIVESYFIKNNKIVVVKPGPQLAMIELSNQVKQIEKKDQSISLITVARLVSRKGIDRVIMALPDVWFKFPQVSYTIVGEGVDKLRLEKLVKELKAEDKIFFVGRLDNDQLAQSYQKQDLFIMLPRNLKGDVEGFGMVYLEAGLFYLPILATDSGGVSEAVLHQQTGIILPENASSKMIANEIIKLLTKPELLKSYGKNNRLWAETFSWQKQAQVLSDLLS